MNIHHTNLHAGELTVVTGIPNSGKSEWIDALLMNLTEKHGWGFAYCSMEKKASGYIVYVKIEMHCCMRHSAGFMVVGACLKSYTFGESSTLCTPQVADHVRQLSEKRMRKPFFDARYSEGIKKMTLPELQTAVLWLNERFHFIRCVVCGASYSGFTAFAYMASWICFWKASRRCPCRSCRPRCSGSTSASTSFGACAIFSPLRL